ncbi:MAG: hypothetical protein NT126_09860 [Bacteroidetes bacterium]|nr:hypothetical protein [Bacteroidota bacterium]
MAIFRMNQIVLRLPGIIFCIIFFSFFPDAYSQSTCTATVDAGNDTSLCAAAVIQLHGTTTAPAANVRSITWSPVTGRTDSYGQHRFIHHVPVNRSCHFRQQHGDQRKF